MKRFIYFTLAGGFAAGCNFGSRILLGHVLSYTTSIILAYIIGMLTAFVLNRLFVFPEANQKLGHQAGWFIAINLLAVLQTLVVSLLLARVVFPWISMDFHPETIAHGIGVAVPVFTSYLGHKRLTFRNA